LVRLSEWVCRRFRHGGKASRTVDRLFLYECSQSTFVDESIAVSRATNERLDVVLAGKAAADRGDTDAAVEILMDSVNDHAGDFQGLPHGVRSVMQHKRGLPTFEF
jgi:hypothetical protein